MTSIALLPGDGVGPEVARAAVDVLRAVGARFHHQFEFSEWLIGGVALRERAERQLRERIGCSLGVTLQAPGTVPRSEGGKLERVVDRRRSA